MNAASAGWNHRCAAGPPPGRCATILRGLRDLLERAGGLPPRHRDALLHGLVDSADGLEAGQRRQLVGRALRSGIARVRRAALDQLCELEGPKVALRRARSDADRTVRAWRPPGSPGPASHSCRAWHRRPREGLRCRAGCGGVDSRNPATFDRINGC